MRTSVALTLLFTLFLSCTDKIHNPIDRKALVRRHLIKIDQPDTLASLSVGNGEFAFTVDVSGLQSFYKDYENGVPLGTQSQWGWHRVPPNETFTLQDVAIYNTSCTGKVIPFPVQHHEGRKKKATHELRTNPHRLHLGIIGLEFLNTHGEKVALSDLQSIHQELDPWTGKIESRYEIEGEPVKVVLYGHQKNDGIAARITSPLIAKGRLRVFFKFPYGSDCHVCPGYNWEADERHRTQNISLNKESALLLRTLDATRYYTQINWTGKGTFTERKRHEWTLAPNDETFDISVTFSQDKPSDSTSAWMSFDQTEQENTTTWDSFWNTGAAIDFSNCTDPRAPELERRVVLSQYLTKIQCAGSLPPQETGLTMNSWYGKFHLEMHWWHGVHFALWDRLPLLEKSLSWYDKVKEKARKTAQWQGFKGLRWQKMTGPYGNESPSGVGTYLVWQQPHPIYYAELIYRQRPDTSTLDKYQDIVFETAAFMADFVAFNEADGFYHLCAPLKPAQELFPAMETNDPPFELSYWHYGLSIAQEWRKRMGLPIDKKWQEIIDKLAPLAIKDGLYLPSATHPQAYKDDFYRRDHPVVVGALGILPETPRVNKKVMEATLQEILGHWQWETTWGWDYPMLAMTAARLGRPDLAVDALLMDVPKNTYLPNGHNYQDNRLRIYLPGNGGLLTATAMMAAGWDGSDQNNPGFPKDGTWNVRWEGLKPMP